MDWLFAPEYSVSTLILRRGIGVIYLVAFAVMVNQWRPLCGANGLLPAPRVLGVTTFRESPGIFQAHYSDKFAMAVGWVGIALSLVVISGVAEDLPAIIPIVISASLWVLYLSIVNVGSTFYGFGWESLLLEAGFLAIFIAPGSVGASFAMILLFRWVVFRLEFGAGLIKLRGDQCWRDLTCLYYHHETQPMPNPLSWYFHHLPKPLHKLEVLGNFFAQLIAPVLLFTPQPIASIAGAVIIITQLWLVISGNFSWLNALTIVLAFSAFDNRFYEQVLGISITADATGIPGWYGFVVVALVAVVSVLSYWPVQNMISRNQRMNFSFNRFHLVNSYGAFGSVTKVRNEVVIEATSDTEVSADTEWREYGFKGKPGDPLKRPPQIAPYHLRLDWLMWFAGISPGYAEGWLPNLLVKLLQNDPGTLRLLRHNPFADEPPRLIRAQLYRYRFTTLAERKKTKAWWVRQPIGEFVPPIALKNQG